MLSLQRLYKLAVRAYMASYILARYSWCKNTTLTESQKVILISMKFRLMATLRVAKKRKGRKAIFASKKTMTHVYFLGFWEKEKTESIEITLGVINDALRSSWPIDRSKFRQAIQYLEELGLYAWKDETVFVISKTDPQNLLPMLNLTLK